MGCGCPRDALCDGCVADGFAQLRGVASCRGEVWAARVARETSTREPWPPYEGRAAAIARRKVEDLTSDPRLRELLAAELARWAARRWRQEMVVVMTSCVIGVRHQNHASCASPNSPGRCGATAYMLTEHTVQRTIGNPVS